MRKMRALVIGTAISTMGCSEWVPANLFEATRADRVRVHERMTLDSPGDEARVVAAEYESPSGATLVRLKREGAWFEVRRRNDNAILVPIVVGFVSAAVLGGLAAWLFGQDRPCVVLCM